MEEQRLMNAYVNHKNEKIKDIPSRYFNHKKAKIVRKIVVA